MLMVTGDLHGEPGIKRLQMNQFFRKRSLTKEDILIVCGDFGLVWDSYETSQEAKCLEWLEEQSYTVVFLDGNHENHDRLSSLSTDLWHGGKVHFLREHVIHLMRGQVFTLAGRKCFVMGGAESKDWKDRTEGIDWWRKELPDWYEMEEGRKNLQKVNWKVDYVLTHEAPGKLLAERAGSGFTEDSLTSYLNIIEEQTRYLHWYFGHHHRDEDYDLWHTCIYEKVLSI